MMQYDATSDMFILIINTLGLSWCFSSFRLVLLYDEIKFLLGRSICGSWLKNAISKAVTGFIYAYVVHFRSIRKRQCNMFFGCNTVESYTKIRRSQYTFIHIIGSPQRCIIKVIGSGLQTGLGAITNTSKQGCWLRRDCNTTRMLLV